MLGVNPANDAQTHVLGREKMRSHTAQKHIETCQAVGINSNKLNWKRNDLLFAISFSQSCVATLRINESVGVFLGVCVCVLPF